MQTDIAEKTISLQYDCRAMLSRDFADFLQNGGLFIKSNQLAFLQQCRISVLLPDSHQPIALLAQVVYLGPTLNKENKCRVLLAFLDENGRNMKQYIESLLEQQP